MIKRILIFFLIISSAIILNHDATLGQTFFCAVSGAIGTGGFLLIKPEVSITERFRMLSVWELMMPVLATVYLTVLMPSELEQNIVFLVFMSIFVAGVSTAAKLLLHNRK